MDTGCGFSAVQSTDPSVTAVGSTTTVWATAAVRLKLSCWTPAGSEEMRSPERTHTDSAVCNGDLKPSKCGLVIVWSVPVSVHLLAGRSLQKHSFPAGHNLLRCPLIPLRSQRQKTLIIIQVLAWKSSRLRQYQSNKLIVVSASNGTARTANS